MEGGPVDGYSWLAVALVVGAIARLWMLSAHSLLIDEAFVAVGARDMLRNHTPMWDAISNAPFVWTIAHLLGMNGLADPGLLRLPSAIIGTATIIPLYFLARRLFNARVASLSVILYAVHPFAVAFSRVLFADSFQVFFILCGWLAFEKILNSDTPSKLKAWDFGLLIVIWALAFLTKYNAVVPGALWLAAGVIAGRYRIRPAILCFGAMTLGAVATLAIWPYDAPIWLSAFLAKGGSYDMQNAAFYFGSKLHLILFGVTEVALVAAITIALRARDAFAKPLGHAALFILLYIVTMIFLGRTFERYLLICVPVACMMLAGLWTISVQKMAGTRHGWVKAAIVLSLFLIATMVVVGAYRSYRSYGSYLPNDTDATSIAKTVTSLERDGHRGFWLLPKPIGAYYLGFSQHYSRSAHVDARDSLADKNYFEFSALPYANERAPYGVQEVRVLAREWGLARILSSPRAFIHAATALRDMATPMTSSSMNYFTSNEVRPGDLLIMQCGTRDVQGEPILEPIDTEHLPPTFTRLPLEGFSVFRTLRPDGISLDPDTTMDPVRTGSWVLLRK